MEMKSQRLIRFFPPPDFLKMPSAGLSIETDCLRLVSFGKKQSHVVLNEAAEFVVEQGTIVNGEILKPNKLLVLLKKIRNEEGVRFARISLPEEKAYVYEAVIPMPEDGEISDSVEFSLEQNIPLAPAETVFDFAVVEGPFSNNNVPSVRVVVSAYPLATAETLVDLLKQAGITPLAMTSESQALARSLILHGDTRPALLVHFLKEKTIIAIVSGGLVRFSTTVSRNLENSEKVLESHEGEKIVESVELLAVRDEVKKVYAYWMSKEGAKTSKDPKGIKSVIVTGYVADMVDISEYLGKHIGTPVFLGTVWRNALSLATQIPEIEFDDSLRFAIAAGVAL